jgi:hypothetical protein
MCEFEEMKQNEVKSQLGNQVTLIKDYKVEQSKNFENTRKRAEQIKVTTTNAVRCEKMSLELAKTATYNKFTKEEQERFKKEEDDREKR